LPKQQFEELEVRKEVFLNVGESPALPRGGSDASLVATFQGLSRVLGGSRISSGHAVA
jgi:hypothetical protein